jgi:hypothetical protein
MDVKVESTPNYVFATLTGPQSPQEVLQAFESIYDAAFGRGSRLILIDCSGLDGSLSTFERLRSGKVE